MSLKKSKNRKKKKKSKSSVESQVEKGKSVGAEGSHKATTAGGAAVAVDPYPCWFQK